MWAKLNLYKYRLSCFKIIYHIIIIKDITMNYQIFSSYNFFFCNNVTYFHKSITYQHSVKTEPKTKVDNNLSTFILYIINLSLKQSLLFLFCDYDWDLWCDFVCDYTALHLKSEPVDYISISYSLYNTYNIF